MPVSQAAILAFLMAGGAGFFMGASVIVVPVTLQWYDTMVDCPAANGNQAGCAVLSPVCVWLPESSSGGNLTASRCAFRDTLSVGYEDCGGMTEVACSSGPAAKYCSWDESAKACRHLPAWSPTQVGVYASAGMGGSTVSTLLGSRIINRVYGGRIALVCVTMALLAFVGVVLTGVAWHVNTGDTVGTFWLQIVGRVIVGFGGGLLTIAGPMLGAEVAPTDSKQTAAILFGPMMTVANVLTALLALAVNPDTHKGTAAIQRLYWLVLAVQLVASVAYAGVCVIACRTLHLGITTFKVADELHTPGDATKLVVNNQGEQLYANPEAELVGGQTTLPPGAPTTMMGRVAVGLLLSTGLQYTGISAVMAFAPRLAKSAGLEPIPGLAVVMAINALAAMGTFPISKRVPVRTMFLVSCGAASVACLVTAVPTLISDHVEGAARSFMNVLIMLGVLGCVTSYQLGMGGSFYVLAQGVFLPGRERTAGFAAAVAWEFISVLLINGLYAPLQSVLSGDGFRGSAGEQRQGQGILWLVFGGVGVVVTLALAKTLHPLKLE